ncbi:MAG: hypothetical protein KF765_06665 [Parvibaculaceae bacterium]|nr:hypothetical protein [Parvibaculaceae bacterium]
MSEKSFVAQCLIGERLLDEVDDFIDQWHEGVMEGDLRECLGLNAEEYAAWLHEPDTLALVVAARHAKVSLEDFLREKQAGQLALAARASSREEAHKVYEWLQKTKRIQA